MNEEAVNEDAVNEQDVRRLLAAAVHQEPPLTLDRDAVLSAGKRRLAMRRTAAAGGVAAAVAAVMIGLTALSGTQFGMSDPVTPAGPAAPSSESSPLSDPLSDPPSARAPTSPAPPIEVTTESMESPPMTTKPTATVAYSSDELKEFAVALRDGPIRWPPGTTRAPTGPGDWFAFDDRGEARFHLVTDDDARRSVIVSVGRLPASELCVTAENGPTCESWALDDGTRVALTEVPPSDKDGVSSRYLRVVRPDGAVVEVADVGGVGSPWLAAPLLDRDALLSIAVLPEFGR